MLDFLPTNFGLQMEGGEPVAQGSSHGTVKAQSSWSHLCYGLLDNSSEPKPRDPQLPSLCDGGPASLTSHSIPQPKAKETYLLRVSASLWSAGRPQSPVTWKGECWGHSTAPQPVATLTTTVKPGGLRARDFRRLVPRALASPPAAWEHWGHLSGRCAGVEPTVEAPRINSRHLPQGLVNIGFFFSPLPRVRPLPARKHSQVCAKGFPESSCLVIRGFVLFCRSLLF